MHTNQKGRCGIVVQNYSGVPVYVPMVSKVACLPSMYHNLPNSITSFVELAVQQKSSQPRHRFCTEFSVADSTCKVLSSGRISHKVITSAMKLGHS